jgi:hypothetical protein
LAELADPRSLGIFERLPNSNSESDAVRIAALLGLQNLADPSGIETITTALKDANPQVQLQAAQALENIGTFAQIDQLYGLLDPNTNPQVRNAVWQDMVKIFKSGKSEEINPWPDQFKNDHEKRLIVLKALRDALDREGKKEQVAYTDQNIGDASMELTPKRAEDAAKSYQAALDFWSTEGKNQPGSDSHLDALTGSMLDALLASKKYQDAADFAAKQLKVSPAYEETVGRKLKTEAQQLHDAGDDANARQLINAAFKTVPWPEKSRFKDDMQTTLDQINAKTPPAPN